MRIKIRADETSLPGRDAVTTPPPLPLAVELTRLVLIGGGEFSFGETREIDEYLLAHLPEGRRRVAFIPAASGSAEYAQHLGAYFRTIDPEVETINVPIYRGRDARRQKNLDLLLSAGMIYLGGGVTNNLLAALHQSAADLAMRDAASNGTLIAAIGAGASCFGTFARDMHGVAPAIPALGWLTGTVVDTAFDPANDAVVRRLMSIPEVERGVAIPPKTALAVAGDGTTELIGSGSVAVFRKG